MTILQLSQEIGIGVDTLRVWERRYGFPIPERNRRGHRHYPPEQVEELRIVKKLQHLGYRPSKIFSLSAAERRETLETALQDQLPQDEPLLRLATELTPGEIDQTLRSELQQLGPGKFVQQVAVPLIQILDRGWTDGSLSIAREHLISDRLEEQMKEQLRQPAEAQGNIKLLFLTLSGERHKLGLVMSALLFREQGIDCLLLQEDLPLSEIPRLVLDLNVAGVALSFSVHFPTRQAKKNLVALRKSLDQSIKLIAGGSAVKLGIRLPGITICSDLREIPDICQREFKGTSAGRTT